MRALIKAPRMEALPGPASDEALTMCTTVQLHMLMHVALNALIDLSLEWNPLHSLGRQPRALGARCRAGFMGHSLCSLDAVPQKLQRENRGKTGTSRV